jgi:hypothetical protein
MSHPLNGNKKPGDFVVFQTYSPDFPDHTRSGFLGTVSEDGTSKPLVLPLGDRRYAIEVKGVGHAAGGFGTYVDSYFKPVTKGGLSIADTQREFTNLERAYRAGLTPIIPLAMGKIALSEEAAEQYGDLGVVFRLTPSTLRLSHRETPASIPMESAADTTVVLDKLITNFLNKFFQPENNPVFISPASHLENYIVDQNFEISETDFEDFREFGSGDFPFIHTQTATFIDVRDTIRHYFTNISRIDGFTDGEHVALAAEMVMSKLASHGIKIDLSECENIGEIADRIWEDWLVEQNHEERRRAQYKPQAMHDFVASNDKDALANLNALESSQAPLRFDLKEVAGDDPELYKMYSGMLDTIQLIKGAASSPNLPNKLRFAALQDVNSQSCQVRAEIKAYAQDHEIPDELRGLVRWANHGYGFSGRVAGGLNFFADYLASEHSYITLLQAKGHQELDGLKQLVSQTQAEMHGVMNSTDPIVALNFFMNKMIGRMQAIYDESGKSYSK